MKNLTHIFELVDVTDEERYYTLGFFTDLEWAIREASQHDPSKWDNQIEDFACSEIRRIAIGLSGQDYTVEWRCEWMPETNEWDTFWTHDEPQLATPYKPLPLCRS